MGRGCAGENDPSILHPLPLQRDTVCAAKTLKRAVQLHFIQQTRQNVFCYGCSVTHRARTDNDRLK